MKERLKLILNALESSTLIYIRTIVFIFLFIAVIITTFSLFNAYIQYTDSPNISENDTFSIPSFDGDKKQEKENTNKIPEKQNNVEFKKDNHPYPELKEEIDEIIDLILPLYLAMEKEDVQSLRGFELRESLTNLLAERLALYNRVLASNNQFDDVVKGLIIYTKDLSNFYIDKFNIDVTLPTSSDIKEKYTSANRNSFNQEIRNFGDVLYNYPADYSKALNRNYQQLLEDVEIEELRASKNNSLAISSLIEAGWASLFILGALLLFLILKVERSIRSIGDKLK